MELQVFDEVHSVSDLHLGGEPDHQIFAGTEELAELINHLGRAAPERRVAFVINGDFLDFLAEPGAMAFDPDGATRKLARILQDPAFAPIFAALGRFVALPNRLLAVVLGNHDLELALPDVREAFVANLVARDDAARGRISFHQDGAGFVALVAGKRVHCVHGNDVDTWNLTDYEHLRRLSADRAFGQKVEPWTPNAGSKMVVEVMNGIKRTYPFVDLLKPETSAVVPILLALDQATASRLRGAAAIAARLGRDSILRRVGLLSAEEDADPRFEGGDPLTALMSEVFDGRGQGRSVSSEALLMNADKRFRSGQDPLALGAGTDGTLGIGGAILDFFRGRPLAEVLREVLEPVARDRSFDPGTCDDTFESLCRQTTRDTEFLIAGHTHLERTLPRSDGGWYFNTGTWARLIRLEPAMLTSKEVFAPIFEALQKHTIAELDATPALVTRRPAVASVAAESQGLRAGIRRVSLESGRIVLKPEGKGIWS